MTVAIHASHSAKAARRIKKANDEQQQERRDTTNLMYAEMCNRVNVVVQLSLLADTDARETLRAALRTLGEDHARHTAAGLESGIFAESSVGGEVHGMPEPSPAMLRLERRSNRR